MCKLILVLAVAAGGPISIPKSWSARERDAAEDVTASVLAAHVRFLADDLLGLDHARPASRRTRMCALLALALAIGLWLALRVYATGHVAAPVGFQSNPLVGAGAGARLLTAAHLLGRTIGLLLAPLVLSADYSYAEILPVHTLARADVLCALALALALPALALRLRTRRPAPS